MKRLLCLIISLMLVCCSLASCSMVKEEKRGQLDTTNVPTVDLGGYESLEAKRTFSDKRSFSEYSFTFKSTSDVQSFKYKAYHTGTYTFSVEQNCDFSVYVHGGNLVTDWFEKAPCTYDLNANYEYTIEVKLGDSSYLNTPIKLKVTTPNTSVQNITGCRSFVDDWTGETEYYTFTAPVAGKYTFTIKNNGQVNMINNGEVVDYTGWDTWSKEFKKGATMIIELERMHRKDIKTVYGYVQYPTETIDITSIVKENPSVALKYEPLWADREVILTLSPSETTTYVVSNTDVGVRRTLEKRAIGGTSEYFYADEGYGIVDMYVENYHVERGSRTITVQAGETATIKICGVDEKSLDKEYYITIFEQDIEKTYKPVE